MESNVTKEESAKKRKREDQECNIQKKSPAFYDRLFKMSNNTPKKSALGHKENEDAQFLYLFLTFKTIPILDKKRTIFHVS